MRTRVKICGITRVEDAHAAIAEGVDAIGLVFYAPSSRAVTIKQARTIVAYLPPFVTVVGLFVNETRERITEVLNSVRIDMLQFHGDETPADCAGYGRPWIKAVSIHKKIDVSAMRIQYFDAAALLLDTYWPGVPGGTGSSFDWSRIPPALCNKIILAGGLTPEIVEQAVRQVRPYAVDVSGGVEESKGIKNIHKIRAFMHSVKRGEMP
jgi:phosphoribosylanthranilate isomerase